MKRTELDRKWEELMSLCRKEEELSGGDHPKLLRFVGREIDRLASEMDFAPRQIAERRFRAERDGDRIVRVFRDE